jgi:hypothetical protein
VRSQCETRENIDDSMDERERGEEQEVSVDRSE